jgi:hypothetical protein
LKTNKTTKFIDFQKNNYGLFPYQDELTELNVEQQKAITTINRSGRSIEKAKWDIKKIEWDINFLAEQLLKTEINSKIYPVLERTLEKVKRKQENTPRKLLRAQRTLLNANRKLKN